MTLSIRQKVIFNSGASIGLKILSSIAGLFVLHLLTNYLGKETYGKYETIYAYLSVLSIIGDFGVYGIVLREVANEAKIFANALTVRLGTLAIFFLLGFALLPLFPYSVEVSTGIMITAPFFIFAALSQLLVTVLQKRLLVFWASIYELISRMIYLAAVWLLVQSDQSLTAFLLNLNISGVIMLALLLYKTRPYLLTHLRFDGAIIKYIFLQSLPIGLANMFVIMYFKLNQVMLSYFHGPSEVAIFALAYKVIETLLFFPSIVTGLIVPILSRSVKQGAVFAARVQQVLKYFMVSASVIVLGIFFWGEQFLRIINSADEFQDAQTVLLIVSIALLFIFIGSCASSIILVLNQQKKSLVIYIAGAFVSVILNYIVMTAMASRAYVGAAIVTVITELLVNSALLIMAIRCARIEVSWRQLFTILGGLLLIGSLSFIVPAKEYVGIILIPGYLAVLYWGKVITPQEIREFVHLRNNLTSR